MNSLIDAYNSDFGANLSNVVSMVDKLEDDQENPGAFFINGQFDSSSFSFFQETDSTPGTTQSIFDANVGFATADLVGDGFDLLDNPVYGFVQDGGPCFDYYVSKSGSGWSLWLAMAGFNPSYTDFGDVSTEFTRGLTSDNSLSYKPIQNGVSHISFYAAESSIEPDPDPAPVPAPATLALLGVGLLITSGTSLRRRDKR